MLNPLNLEMCKIKKKIYLNQLIYLNIYGHRITYRKANNNRPHDDKKLLKKCYELLITNYRWCKFITKTTSTIIAQ